MSDWQLLTIGFLAGLILAAPLVWLLDGRMLAGNERSDRSE